jgi:hypothetical protein
MGFIQEKVLRYRGGILRCSPIASGSWASLNEGAGYTENIDFNMVEQQGDFDLRIRGFCMGPSNVCDGFVGEVVQLGHWLSGYWAIVTPQAVGDYDLTENPPYSLRLDLYPLKYTSWKKYDWPQFPACRLMMGECRPQVLTCEGRGFELSSREPTPTPTLWEQRAMSQFAHLQERPGRDGKHI